MDPVRTRPTAASPPPGQAAPRVPAAARTDDGQSKRAAPRLKVFIVAALCQGESAQRVHVLNLSRTGALCHAPVPPETGQRTTLQLGERRLQGTVAWASGSRFGFRFDLGLADAGLAAIIAAGCPAS